MTGSRFGVRSKVLVGSTDLELAMNLQVRGTVGQPELWNRVEIQPGGKMTYDVVRREFEVVRGTLDFTGPMTEPLVDLTARTRVEYAGSAGDALVSSSRFSPDDSGGGLFDDQAVLVTLSVVTVLVGMNNSGKTSFLKALHLALGADRRVVSADDFFAGGRAIGRSGNPQKIVIDVPVFSVPVNPP